MRWLLLSFILVGCSTVPAPKGPPPAGRPIRLASWNVHNLFDEIDDSYNDDVFTPAEVRTKLDRLARVLGQIEPDFVGLQEVEHLVLAERLARRLPGYQAILVEGNDKARGINVAVLTRLPIGQIKSHAGEVLPTVDGAPEHYHFSRDCLEVRLMGELPLTVLVNHFLSKRQPGVTSDAKRRAQALGVASLVGGLPGRVAVLGDFNDDPDSWALEPLRSALLDSFAAWPMEKRYTHVYRKRKLAIDHIFLDRELAGRVVDRKVWRDGVKGLSDHYPVSVDLR
ncbi:MAG: endonuclease/exonuclease/phosphatase family protein [Candidatus Eremiobacteraeota bacterium]|nr:endonuclease/exonuclease/phosphatase family protein [Candidatus Eremiobacteraeota bacterium]